MNQKLLAKGVNFLFKGGFKEDFQAILEKEYLSPLSKKRKPIFLSSE
jgi:hypothetical protein